MSVWISTVVVLHTSISCAQNTSRVHADSVQPQASEMRRDDKRSQKDRRCLKSLSSLFGKAEASAEVPQDAEPPMVVSSV